MFPVCLTMIHYNFTLQAGSAFFAYQRYRQGADSAFATAYETGMGAPGGVTTPGSGMHKLTFLGEKQINFQNITRSWRLYLVPGNGHYC